MNDETKKIVAKIGLALVATFSIASFVHATTVYDENILGDFNAGQLFTLNDTHNLFVGSQAMGSDPVDGFRFVVQEGYRATINFSQSFSNLSPNEAQAWVWDLSSLPAGTGTCIPDANFPYNCNSIVDPGQQYLAHQVFMSEPGFADPAIPFPTALGQVTLVAGTYLLADNFGFSRAGAGGAVTGLFSYSIDIQQTAVPIPAAVWLFGSGLIGLMGTARRRAVP